MAKISELKAKAGFDFVEGKIVSKSDARDVRNGELKVADAQLKDESGTVKLTLWNDEIGTVNNGDKVKVTKGWCNEFQGEISISAGKFGQLEVLEKAAEEIKDEGSMPDDVRDAIENDII